MSRPRAKVVLAGFLAVVLIAGLILAHNTTNNSSRTNVTAYFDNANGLYVGDEVRILGVPVGSISKIEAEPGRVRVDFWYGADYAVPAEADAVILSPSLVTARAVQLTPAYTDGPTMRDRAVIPQSRTAVPVEWDDLRVQLEKLTESLQPTSPGGVSTLGAFVNTTADNLRGQGADIRDTLIKMSQAFAVLGDHSGDIFGTIRNLSVLISALHSSADLIGQLNRNLAGTTALLSNDPLEISNAIADLDRAVVDVQSFVAENRDSMTTSTDKLASVTSTVIDSLDDIKQLLHIGPTAFQNFVNIYQPAQSALTGALAANMFANPITFLCGAIQAASRLGAEQSAKLCVQYLAPIIKNRQYNFPPVGINPFVGTMARPNEITYSEDWLRPDYVPPLVPESAPVQAAPLPAEQTSQSDLAAQEVAPLPSEPVATDPSQGLNGMMVPSEGGQ